jgi:alcohol dehydrogenase, propanol-preferring
MQVMVLSRVKAPLVLRECAPPDAASGEVRIRVSACAVCRTDLHIVDGELADPKLPLIPGHEVIGRVVAVGSGVTNLRIGDRVGVPWLGWTCGVCDFCRRGQENLCPKARFTGYHIDGGFASELCADARFVFPIPEHYSDEAAAPLMCAGVIGWRALQAAGSCERLGIYGFGAAAHIVAQVARARGQSIYAFVRPGDTKAKEFALAMGAEWAGHSDAAPPAPLDAAIIFAPAGELVPAALRAVRPGGTVVCGGIHMSDIPSFPYAILWGERVVRSVANLTRSDGASFLAFAAAHPIHTVTSLYPLTQANEALSDLRYGRLNGAAVLMP